MYIDPYPTFPYRPRPAPWRVPPDYPYFPRRPHSDPDDYAPKVPAKPPSKRVERVEHVVKQKPSLIVDRLVKSAAGDYKLMVVEVPGATKDQIDVSVHSNALTIKADYKPVANDEYRVYHCITCTFDATFNLDKIDVALENGLLTIIVPQEPQKPSRKRKIKIR